MLDDLRISARPARPPGAGRRRRRHAAGRAQPHRPDVAAGRVPARRQRHPHPGRGPQPRQRGPRRHGRLQGPADARQGLGRRARGGGVPRRARRRVRLDRHGRARRHRRGDRPALRARPPRERRGAPSCPATPGWCSARRAARAWAGSAPDKQVRLVRGDRDAFGLHGRSAEQRIAIDLLLDPDVGIVSPRRPRRHRQVGAGPVRRPRGGAWSAASSAR